MARIKKEEKKSNTLLLVLVGIMLFGTVAGGLLFQSPRQEDQPLLTTPPPLTIGPMEQTVTIRHNPVNTIIVTPEGRYQTITHDNNSIFVDSNHPLVGKTIEFDIQVTNLTRANFTGDAKTLTVENGDVIEVNYTGRLFGGEVFDTSLPEIAGNESVPKVSWFSVRPSYEPLEFTVGAGMMIPGFDEAVLDMEINETKTVEIPPEEGYGLHNPSLIQAMPRHQQWQKSLQLQRKRITYSTEEFQGYFGDVNITEGQVFNVPGTNFNATITYASGDTTITEMLLNQDEVIRLYEYPWDSTVVSMLPGQITLEHNLESGDVVQFEGLPWNSTVL